MSSPSYIPKNRSKNRFEQEIVILEDRWWAQRDSNPRPTGCKPDALDQLSYAPEGRGILAEKLLVKARFHHYTLCNVTNPTRHHRHSPDDHNRTADPFLRFVSHIRRIGIFECRPAQRCREAYLSGIDLLEHRILCIVHYSLVRLLN